MPAKKKSLDALDDNLSNMLESTDSQKSSDGTPLQLDISLIDDNPLNRTDVSEAFKNELTDDIELVGVKEPISVRDHPTDKGRYMINSGHTRKECSIRANKKTIPAFIDNSFDDYDMVKVNMKRETQSPRSIAEFIERRLTAGEKKSVIAKKLGKSPAFVSQHVALLNLPDLIQSIFDSGRCSDVTLINDLVRLYKKHPECVKVWLEDNEQDITRNSYKLLCNFIEHKKDDKSGDSEEGGETETGSEGGDDSGDNTDEPKAKVKKPADPTVMAKVVIRICYQGRDGMLLPKIRPTETGRAYIKFDDDGDEIEAQLKDIEVVSLMEG